MMEKCRKNILKWPWPSY